MLLQKFTGIALGFTVLALVFTVLERFFPAIPGQRWWKAGSRVDLYYWLFTPFVTKSVGRASVIVAILVSALVLGAPIQKPAFEAWLQARRTPITDLPAGVQLVLAALLADLIGYVCHRLFHKSKRLWPFHAVHHAPRELDWISAVRVHPINEALTRIVQVVPLFFLGFRPVVLGGVAPLFVFYAFMLHANLSWSFGPLRYVLASPTFHRWHHTAQSEGLDKNFAGLFPVFDLLFGTFYMPPGKQPTRFGVIDDTVPEGFWVQLAHPFKRR